MENKNFAQKIFEKLIFKISNIKLRNPSQLSEESKDLLRGMLAKDYYIIGVYRKHFLTTFFINLGHFVLTGKWGKYNHVLVNLEDEVKSDDDFRLIEATTIGTKYSSFKTVFSDVDSVILLKPKNISIEEWTSALDSTREYLGRPYDTLFDIKTTHEINCVELIWLAISRIPDYKTKFPHFTSLVENSFTITPQMFIDSSDFEIVKVIDSE